MMRCCRRYGKNSRLDDSSWTRTAKVWSGQVRFFFSSRRRHTSWPRAWSSDVCSSDLFATGFFRDVRLEAENDVLVILVDERPAVAQIDLVGIKEFQTDAVKRILRDAGLSEGRTFDRSILDFAEQELKRQYLSRGRYAA